MTDPCRHESRLTAIETRHERLMEALKKMEDKFDAKLDMIIFQINKIAVLEEKHTHQSQALSRAFEKIESLERVVDSHEKFKSKTEGMAKMAWLLWGAMGTGLGLLFLKTVFGN